MKNSVNDFNAAKVTGVGVGLQTTPEQRIEFIRSQVKILVEKHNKLVDVLSQQIKILEATIANGISVDDEGVVALGLASSTTTGALSSTDWSTFNGKQDHSNELDAIAAFTDSPGLMKKTGDGTYSRLAPTAENDFIVANAGLEWTNMSLAAVTTLVGGGGGSSTDSGNWRFA